MDRRGRYLLPASAALALLSAAALSSCDVGGVPSCASIQACVQDTRTGPQQCRQACSSGADAGPCPVGFVCPPVGCPDGTQCVSVPGCCNGDGCTAAPVAVCCADSGC